MSKPKRIILIRHGESEGNIDRDLYSKIPDYAIDLTDKGKKQALELGEILKSIIGKESFRIYQSSFYRTRRTTEYLLRALKDTNSYSIREDQRLIEQGWGNLVHKDDQERIKKERDEYSHFYYRAEGAENGLDVYTRISTFLDTLQRDFRNIDFEDNCFIVSHGLTIRLFLARWFHFTVEKYEAIKNPKNCQYYILEKTINTTTLLSRSIRKTEKYILSGNTPLEHHNVYHKYKYIPDFID